MIRNIRNSMRRKHSAATPPPQSRKNLWVTVFVPMISILSIVIAIASFGFTYFGFPFGKTIPLIPSGYAIIREFPSFPSDHLVIPLEWQNTERRAVLLRQPYLVLRKLDAKGQETATEYRFTLAGDYAEISTEAFQKMYRIRNAYILQPQSITSLVLVFHTQHWWDETNAAEYRFRFATEPTYQQTYHVYIGYMVNTNPHPEQPLFAMKMFRTVDRLDRNTTFWWDYWDKEISE